MSLTVRVLEAGHGDCILISHHDGACAYNVLIDGGTLTTFYINPQKRIPGQLKIALDGIIQAGEFIDLLILTHIDNDHIAGLIKAFQVEGYLSKLTKKLWFNSSRSITDYFLANAIPENDLAIESPDVATSAKQGNTFEELIASLDIWDRQIIQAGERRVEGPCVFQILSPTEEDLRKLLCIWPKEETSTYTAGKRRYTYAPLEDILLKDKFVPEDSITNKSSIAFILTIDQQLFLFLGDAAEYAITESLEALGYSEDKPLALQLFKVSHHGSKKNTSNELLKLVTCENFVISTNGDNHGHPDREVLAKILLANDNNKIFFNYRHRLTEAFSKEELHTYGDRIQAKNTWNFK
ncbi:MBL fold metallo-hydrolase [Pseudomonas syringae]|nr:MBL fold metallo-hydrolase [Pseudomonas syringae]